MEFSPLLALKRKNVAIKCNIYIASLRLVQKCDNFTSVQPDNLIIPFVSVSDSKHLLCATVQTWKLNTYMKLAKICGYKISSGE